MTILARRYLKLNCGTFIPIRVSCKDYSSYTKKIAAVEKPTIYSGFGLDIQYSRIKQEVRANGANQRQIAIHTYGQLRVVSKPNLQVYGMWHLEQTHTGAGRTWKYHTERPQVNPKIKPRRMFSSSEHYIVVVTLLKLNENIYILVFNYLFPGLKSFLTAPEEHLECN